MQPAEARLFVVAQARWFGVQPPTFELVDPSFTGSWWRVCPAAGHSRRILIGASVRQVYADPAELLLF